jgi:hypothetical protein
MNLSQRRAWDLNEKGDKEERPKALGKRPAAPDFLLLFPQAMPPA